MIGIYKITSPSGKVYIGQSVNIETRKEHYSNIKKCIKQPRIYNSLKKYGWEAHIFEIIEECTLEQLDERETFHKQQVIHEHGWDKALFCNLIDGKGGHKSEETKQKLSKILSGRYVSQQTKDLISKNKIGKKYSQQTKDLMSKSALGKKKSKTHKENIGLAKKGNKYRLGTKHTLENKQSIGEKNRKPKPKGFGEKISKANKGKIGPTKYKPIFQYDLEGNFIKEWSSIKEAEIFYFGKPNDSIGSCCRGKTIQVKNFKWKYK